MGRHGRFYRFDFRWVLAVAALGLGGACGQVEEMPALDVANNSVALALPDGEHADAMRDVLLVGNSYDGTVSFIDAQTFENLGSVNAVPDYVQMMWKIHLNPIRLIAYTVVKYRQQLHHFEPGDGDRFVDDVFLSPDGTVLYVSRSNLGDVAAYDLTEPDHPQLWRKYVHGFKADHAAISPDGSHLVVSATSSRKADVFESATGKRVGSFSTGDYPHQNDYSKDGRYIYNSSIGDVGYKSVPYRDNHKKGDRWLVKADADSLEVVATWEFDYGIRPNVITADDRIMYAQLSYLNGVIKYDLTTGTEIARNEQPLSEFARATYANEDEYPHDSAHHGLSLSGDGSRLCDCGTIDNTVAIVKTDDMTVEHMLDVGLIPYWATTGPTGKYCFVTLSGDDSVIVIDFERGEQVAEVPVGRFPQRSRLARVPNSVIELLTPPSAKN
ncbi:MAG: WD40 repeat domain-containing protein [Proteobacteria bacterium]|nr:WD40 repeat domain-containing protein [Pseudomonadota bacterium]